MKLDSEGFKAIDLMIEADASCHLMFGDHASPVHFAVALSQPQFKVMCLDRCWVILEDLGSGMFDAHWFCPDGVNVDAVRAMLLYAFDNLGAKLISGRTPPGHFYERAARMAARAIGMERHGDLFMLTRQRLESYTAKRNSRSE